MQYFSTICSALNYFQKKLFLKTFLINAYLESFTSTVRLGLEITTMSLLLKTLARPETQVCLP